MAAMKLSRSGTSFVEATPKKTRQGNGKNTKSVSYTHLTLPTMIGV